MSALNIAQRQLFSRPPEEHFPDFASVRDIAFDQKQRCATVDARDTTVLFLPDGESVAFGDATLRLTHYSLAQLASMAARERPSMASRS